MRKMAGITALGLAALLSGAVFAAAEVALDEVVQAGRFVFYRDHADPHRYYYVPDAPRLAAKRDGTPEFTFIKYAKTGGETKGGVVHFLVTWGYTSGELSSAESALKSTDPQARIAGPVPFKEGTFQVVSATAGEGGLFNRRIVGEGKAPIMPGQKAAVSIALTEEGASLLWESFKNPTSDVSVLFALKFTGVTPAFQAKLKVDWDKVYTHHDVRLQAEGTIKVVKLRAEMQAILDELRQKGVIQLDVVGENENMQKMLDTVYTHILNMMCEPVPMGAGGAAPSPPVKAPMTVAELGPPAWSYDVLADLVRESGERLRGGPSWQQEQAAAGQTTICDDQSRQRADMLARRAGAFFKESKLNGAVETYGKAYEACPDPKYLYEIGTIEDIHLRNPKNALDAYRKYVERAEGLGRRGPEFDQGRRRLDLLTEAEALFRQGVQLYADSSYPAAAEIFEKVDGLYPHGAFKYNLGMCLRRLGEATGRPEYYERAVGIFRQAVETEQARHSDARQADIIDDSRKEIEEIMPLIGAGGAARDPAAKPAQATEPTAKPPTGQEQAAAATAGQAQQQTATQAAAATPPAGQTPPAKPAAQTPGTPAAKPAAAAPEVKPIVSVSLGYTFKRVKMSGRYEVDMRKRLREDRDIVMSGNISGVFQKYGEDKRFFTVVSLDDPTFQERSVEVILDGQDAEDFKNYINTVSVLFRKQRFSGAPMTGEVKFFADQFAQSGNRLSFRYGRLNEASTEWLTYEYKPKWSFYGGVEWEGEWTRTSDSVLTLAPPVRRRTLEISVDEDNILKNNIKALAVQIRHRVYGKDLLKEVIIDYGKGDPLQARYTYMHEEGSPGYSYKVIWLTTDGREVATDWVSRESPFIYAVFRP